MKRKAKAAKKRKDAGKGKDMAQELEELRQLETPALVARYEELFGKPPRTKHRAWLFKRCVWKLQERRFGGLSVATRRRLDELMAEIDFPLPDDRRTVTGSVGRGRKPGEPPVGTILTREWRGTEVRVTVVEGGYEHAGVVHRSLSAAVKAITGSHWNGKLFFGLTQRRAKE